MPRNKNLRVLLIEDSESDANLIVSELEMVEDLQVNVEHVETCERALDKLINTGAMDAAILDLNLPDSHGLVTYKKLRDQAPDLPIIVFTGNDDRTQAVQALNEGADGYLFKSKLQGNRIATAILASIARRNLD